MKKLGLKSWHWKRLARGAHAKDQGVETIPKKIKRESSTPVHELSANTLELIKLEPTDQPYKIQKKENQVDGGVAAAAGQHYQAQ